MLLMWLFTFVSWARSFPFPLRASTFSHLCVPTWQAVWQANETWPVWLWNEWQPDFKQFNSQLKFRANLEFFFNLRPIQGFENSNLPHKGRDFIVQLFYLDYLYISIIQTSLFVSSHQNHWCESYSNFNHSCSSKLKAIARARAPILVLFLFLSSKFHFRIMLLNYNQSWIDWQNNFASALILFCSNICFQSQQQQQPQQRPLQQQQQQLLKL